MEAAKRSKIHGLLDLFFLASTRQIDDPPSRGLIQDHLQIHQAGLRTYTSVYNHNASFMVTEMVHKIFAILMENKLRTEMV